MTDTAPPTRVERVLSIAAGLSILLMAALGIAWAAHWSVLWLKNPDALPGEMIQVLLVAVGAGVVIGIGSWRLLLIGITRPVLGLPAGGVVLAALALGAVIGAAA
ncbi:MAG TPA: hypothetical protein VMB75_04675 [Rhodocyclaceae bacterium]|nr:hypothetical protein [Rhodocyclaceae bacterium]